MDTSFPPSLEIREGMIRALNEVVALINSGDTTVDNVKDMALTRILQLLPSEYMEYCNVWATIKDIPQVTLGPMLDYFAWKTLVAELAGLAQLEVSADETSKERAAQLRRQLILPKGLDVNAPGHSVDREVLRTKLTDYRMHNGSRNFVDLPQTHLWYSVRDHVSKLAGAELTGFVTDGVTEGWIDFSYCGHDFTINDQFGDYLFFVKDPTCPDSILMDVSAHFAVLLGLADE